MAVTLPQGPRTFSEQIQDELERRERIERCRDDFIAFMETYFGGTARMEDTVPAFHHELALLATDLNYVDPLTGERVWYNSKGRRKKGLVIAAPRGHAKTTILTFFYSLWCILYRKKRFIILVNNAALGAVENVTDLRDELEANDVLKNDFGDLCGQDLGYKWRQNDFIAVHRDSRTNKVLHTTRVVAKSPGAKIRGIKYNGYRPDALIVDDLENDESVENPDQIQKVHNWLNKAAIPSLDPRRGTFIMVGTIMHFDAVLARLLAPARSEIYVQRVYRAYWRVKGRLVYLWPERFTPADLEMKRIELGSLAFNCEYLNDPIDPEARNFRPEWIRWYEGSDLKFERGRWYFRRGDIWNALTIYQAVDPAIKKEEQEAGDFLASITIGITEEDDILQRAVVVLYAYKERLDFPSQVQTIIRQFNTYPMTRAIGVETTGYQGALKQELLRREMLPIRQIEHTHGTRDKKLRITRNAVMMENGQFYMRAAAEDEAGELEESEKPRYRVYWQQRELYDDLMRYPRISHDDLLDVLDMAIELGGSKKGFANYREESPRAEYNGVFNPPPLTNPAPRTVGIGVPYNYEDFLKGDGGWGY